VTMKEHDFTLAAVCVLVIFIMIAFSLVMRGILGHADRRRMQSSGHKTRSPNELFN
jgi:hypothetical protein